MTWFNLLLMPENLLWAWRKVRRCYRMADGLFDQAEIAAFELNLEAELASIRHDFETGNWRNRPIRLVPQPKKPGKDGKPRLRQYFEVAVRDQVAWIALVNVLGPELDQKMPAWSYGNRLYRAAWYEEETAEGRHSKLNIGPYRHSAGYLYRHFKHSWPLFRRHISLTARKMVGENIEEDDLDAGERLALEQGDRLAYFHPSFSSHPASGSDTLYAASLDLSKFYPSVQVTAIQRGFNTLVEGFADEPRLSALLTTMLRFEVDDEGLDQALKAKVDPIAPVGPFDGIPTGLFVGGFLANVAMLPIDREVEKLLLEHRDVAHFRFVDDHEFLAYDFDRLLEWMTEYAHLLARHGIGVEIEREKYSPSELKWLLHPDETEAPMALSELRSVAITAASVDGRKPTQLMTRTLAQVSMLAATDFDLLTDAGRSQRLEQLEWLLLANIPNHEIRGDTRMAFAAARIANLTPALFRPNEELLFEHRRLQAAIRGKATTDLDPALVKPFLDRIAELEKTEHENWRALVKRHFGLLFEAFATHPDKVRLFTRLLDYCRVTGHDGFDRVRRWMADHADDDHKFLQSYLGAMALHVLARHVLTASVALSRPDLLHRERDAARAFLGNLLRADLEAFVPRPSETDRLQRFQWNARRAFEAALVLGSAEVALTDASLSNEMLVRAIGSERAAAPIFAVLLDMTGVPLGVWFHWLFATTGAHPMQPPVYWATAAVSYEPSRPEDWNGLRRYPRHLPPAAWKRLAEDPFLLKSDDEGWLLDAARTQPDRFAALPNIAPVIGDVRARVTNLRATLSLVEWTEKTAAMDPSDPRRSEWTALEIVRQILEPIFDPEGPDMDYLDRLHPEGVGIPLEWLPVDWKALPEAADAGDKITWEAWQSLMRRTRVAPSPGLRDYRYHEVLVSADDRAWPRRLRALGQILWGMLRQSFVLPAAWNIRGQERSLIEIVARDVERLPISSFTISILRACLLPRSRETSMLTQFPMLFGNAKGQSADDTEFDQLIDGPDALLAQIKQAQDVLQKSQMTVLEHEPRQLIPVRLRQMGAFVDGMPNEDELEL
ncbi:MULTISPECIES: hypothetical protein [unclassified Sphingobium]|uniref:RNA-directed DNA polymerase n=1 Tax=unclassified Sphingobium TaxID=2611147 RepID=UPI0035A6E7C5